MNNEYSLFSDKNRTLTYTYCFCHLTGILYSFFIHNACNSLDVGLFRSLDNSLFTSVWSLVKFLACKFNNNFKARVDLLTIKSVTFF